MLHIVAPYLLTLATAVTVFYLIYVAVYRLYFSPIAKFPGPRLAALTFGYEFYYDVVKSGRYTWQIGKLHEQYGQSALFRERKLSLARRPSLGLIVCFPNRSHCAYQSI